MQEELGKEDFDLLWEALNGAARQRESGGRAISDRFPAFKYRDLAEKFNRAHTAWLEYAE